MKPLPSRARTSRLSPFGIALALLPCLDAGAANAAHVGVSAVGSQIFDNVDLALHEARDNDFFAISLATGDFNGDGADDLATGIPWDNGNPSFPEADAGAVTVRYGTLGKGLGDTPAPTFLSQLNGGESVNDVSENFGYALAAGDFNEDGYDDLAVGAPQNREGTLGLDTGAVFIFYGSPTGISPVAGEFIDQATEGLPNFGGNQAQDSGDLFGNALAVGDFNGDVYDDLAIGAPGDAYCFDLTCDGNIGSVTVVHGGPKGLTPIGVPDRVISQLDPAIPDTGDIGDRFGSALAAGDFNGDSFDDLAIGVPEEDSVGAVLVLFGSSATLVSAYNVWWGEVDLGGSPESGDQFGAALAAGDFDGDGNDDLAIGAPSEDLTGANAGELTVLQGTDLTETVPIPQLLYARKWFDRNRTDHWRQSNIFGSTAYDQADDAFAGALASGDFNGDGYADLAVGHSGEDVGGTDRGGVTVLTGSATIGLIQYYRFLASGINGVPGPTRNGQFLGASLAAGDFDDDGYSDLAIGAPGRDVTGLGDFFGAEIVLYGSLFADGFAGNDTFEWSGVAP